MSNIYLKIDNNSSYNFKLDAILSRIDGIGYTWREKKNKNKKSQFSFKIKKYFYSVTNFHNEIHYSEQTNHLS